MKSRVLKINRRYVLAFLWFLVALCMAAIFMLSNQVAVESQKLSNGLLVKIMEVIHIDLGSHGIRKAAHGSEYFGLALLVFAASKATWQKNRPYFTFLFALLYAVSDEIHQIFIPGRACRFTDICIDCAGALAGILLCSAVISMHGRAKHKKAGRKDGNYNA